MKYKTYLFDFDGTLVDSMPAYVGLMLRILDENNVKYENDIIKILNLEQFNLKIDKLDTIKTNNILYCYITLANKKDKCPL